MISSGEYSAFVADQAYTKGEKELAIYALGLTGEAGETAEHVKKLLDRNRPIDPETILLELGDVLWYLQALANFFHFTLDEIAQANVAKLQARRAAAKVAAGAVG